MKILFSIFLLFSPFSLFSQQVSFYSDYYEGRKTASGVVFSNDSLYAASPTLKFGTKLKVTNLDNMKSVVVTVVDRGSYKVGSDGKVLRPLQPHPTRALDLSKKAFSMIADTKKGVINVKIEIIHED
jgi:rare lipoprotein A